MGIRDVISTTQISRDTGKEFSTSVFGKNFQNHRYTLALECALTRPWGFCGCFCVLLVIPDLLVWCLAEDPQVSLGAAFRMFSLSLSNSHKQKGANASFSGLESDYLPGAMHAVCLVLRNLICWSWLAGSCRSVYSSQGLKQHMQMGHRSPCRRLQCRNSLCRVSSGRLTAPSWLLN